MVNTDNVRAYLLLLNINNVDMDTAYFGNYYLLGFNKDKIYTAIVLEFGELKLWVLICVRYTFFLNTSMYRWHDKLSDNLNLIGL